MAVSSILTYQLDNIFYIYYDGFITNMISPSFVKKLRLEKGFSQEYIAKKLGFSRPSYIQFEKGEKELTISEAEKLASIFDLSLQDLISDKESNEFAVVLGKKKKSEREEIKMRINVPQKKMDKFKEVFLYILEKVGAKPNVGETVLYKLLYFIDFDFYEKYEEQLIGATYIKNHFGPTPVEFGAIVAEMERMGEVEKIKSSYFQHEQKKYLPRRKANLSCISGLEKELIDDVLNRLSDKTATDLSEYSHLDTPWIIAEQNKPIDYEAVFYRTANTAVRDYERD